MQVVTLRHLAFPPIYALIFHRVCLVPVLQQNPLPPPPLCHARYMPHPPHPSGFQGAINIRRGAQNMKSFLK